MKKKVSVLIALLLFSAVSYVAYTVYQVLNPETLFEPQQPYTQENTEPKRPTQAGEKEVSVHVQQSEEEQYRFDEKRVNILLLGLDANERRYRTMGAFRTDTIILMSIDFQDDQVYLISIPRDSYVKIPGREQKDRINTAFVWGGGFKGKGFEKTVETVSDFLGGVPIHYYVGVDMNAFVEIIDIMGGVEFEVDVPVKVEGRELKPGLQRLNGQQVLDYCRNRHFPWGDIERIKNQQKMLLAIFDQLKSSKQLLNVTKYYEAVKDKIYTNLNAKQIAALGVFGMKLGLSNIHTYSIPGDFLDIGGVSYWGVDQYKKRDLVKEIFGVEIKVDPRDDVKYIKKELEERLKTLQAAVDEANEVIKLAQEVMTTYSAYIEQDEKATVESCIDKINQSMVAEDPAAIQMAASELKDYTDNLTQICAQRQKEDEERKAAEQALNDARKDAQQVIQWVTAQIEEKGDRLSPEDRQKIEASIAVVAEALKVQNAEDIVNKTAELKKQAEIIFNVIEDDKEEPKEENDSNDIQEGSTSSPEDGVDGSTDSEAPEKGQENPTVPDETQENPGLSGGEQEDPEAPSGGEDNSAAIDESSETVDASDDGDE